MPTVLNYPGVYIEELPSAVRTITGVPTSITAFVGRAWKGPIDQPVTVNSLADYERMFGGLWVGSSMSYAIAQFFANGGGQAIVVRVVNRTEAAGTAATTTKFAVNGGTKLEASSPGTWGNNLSLTVDTTANPDLPPDPGRFHLTVLIRPIGRRIGQAWWEWRAGVVPERVDHANQPALPPSGPGRAVEAHPRAGRPGGERRRVGTRRQCHHHQHGSQRRSRWGRHRHERCQGRVGSRHRHVRAQPG